MITYNKASERSIRRLSKKMLQLLEDKNGQVYQDNVAKFGIPEEYVKAAFSEEKLLELLRDAKTGRTTFYLATENKRKILGFAQTVERSNGTTELDRIVVFPEQTRKGIGTALLQRALKDEKRKGTKTVTVNAGKNETHARLFYEKNGFKLLKEKKVETPWGKTLNLVIYQLQI